MRDSVGGLELHARDVHVLLHGHAAPDEAEQHAHGPYIRAGEAGLTGGGVGPDDAGRLERAEHRRRDARALRQVDQAERLAGDEHGVRQAGQADGRCLGEHRGDGPQRVAASFQVTNAFQAVQVGSAVQRHSAFVARGRQQTLGLIRAQHLNAHTCSGGKFFHSVGRRHGLT
jgi:hypothetical protein